jgi:tetratricopeptide (TPR) repeat protein
MADAAPAPSLGTITSQLPQPRNPNFVGRDRVIHSLERALKTDGQAVQVIYGTPGVGKTQLAMEYAYRHPEQYRIIGWLPAAEPNTLAIHYRRLAQRLNVLDPDASAEETKAAVRRELRRRSDWLLIFDDAPAPDAITPYLPSAGNGHVLVTSRNSGWQQFGMPFCLRVLERVEAREFLRRRIGATNDLPAVTLAQALGDLPLALEQASAVIAAAGISIDEYLHRYENLWAELLQSGRTTGDYPESVEMTWELSCRELQNSDSEVSGLLKILSHLAPVEMPRPFLLRAMGNLPVPFSTRFGGASLLDGAVDLLRKFSLLTADAYSISVHPLISTLTRQHLPDPQKKNWCEAALNMMAATFRFDAGSMSGWNECAVSLPHALAASGYAHAQSVAPDANAKLLNEVGEYLTQMGRLEQGREAFELSLALTEQAHGRNDPRRSAIINNLGRVMKRSGNLKQARAHFEEALVLDQAAYGQSHAHVAEVVNNYATVLHLTGDPETALVQFEWALEVCRTCYGDDNLKVAVLTNNVGYARAAQGNMDAALESFTEALAIAEASAGPNHPTVASILTNLGTLLRLKGQGDAAHEHLERAAGIHRAASRIDHPEMARSLAHLGRLHRQRGQLDLAIQHFKRALQIDQNLLGDGHPQLINRLDDLGRCLKQANDIDGAAGCFERIAEIRRNNVEV